LVKCHAGCAQGDVLAELRGRQLFEDLQCRPTPAPRRSRAASPPNTSALRIWDKTRPLTGTLGATYFERRGLTVPTDCNEVRFHPDCPREARRQPAVVWLMRDIVTDQPRAIQRRFLLPDGTKDGPAISLGSCTGAVLKLTPDCDVTTGLALAEGHADALAVIGAGWSPCWATCGTGTMAGFPVLDGIEALTIFADAGAPGLKAARACAERWREAGREVCVVEPPGTHSDFGEVANG
jgi:hypothetical protein